MSGYLAEAMAAGSIRAPRDVALEAEFQDVLPPLEMNIGPGELAGIFATVLQRDHTPPSVAVDHIHLPLVSVSEQRGHILSLLRAGEIDFAELLETAENTLVVVARFLALLELFKVGLCDFDQPEPLGRLLIHRTEMSEDGVDLRTEGDWSGDESGDDSAGGDPSMSDNDEGADDSRGGDSEGDGGAGDDGEDDNEDDEGTDAAGGDAQA